MARKTRPRPNHPESDDEVLVEESSGNVFADLGLPGADELLAKAELTRHHGPPTRTSRPSKDGDSDNGR